MSEGVAEAGKVWAGFDLGGTKMPALVYDDDLKPLGRKRRKTRGSEGAENGMARIESTIEKTLADLQIDLPNPTLSVEVFRNANFVNA